MGCTATALIGLLVACGAPPVDDDALPVASVAQAFTGALCADGTQEQALPNGMVGCAGAVTFANRGALCAAGSRVATAAEWAALHSGIAPTHDYWTNDALKYNGSGPSSCFVSTGVGTDCGATPMRVCTAAGTDIEGNQCNWQHCGIDATAPDQFFGGCVGNTFAGALCVPNTGCADGTVEQVFLDGMVGCAGAVTFVNRASLCAPGYQPANSAQWVASRGTAVPTHDYWTADALKYSGSGPSACSVSTTVGTDCGATPMRVCTAAGTDTEGNQCNWQHCGIDATAPDQFFGGCVGNTFAGALCVPDQPGGTKFSDLPFVDAASNPQVVAELLAKPTALGETTALHVRLPPPRNQELQSSLVRVIGQPESPQVLFSSDALAKLGVIKSSPGKDFFTAFSTLPPEEIQRLVDQQEKIASGTFGQATNETLLFAGRSPVARTINPRFDTSVLQPGIPFSPLGCPFVPVSNQAAWDKSLFIRDPAVVQDVSRTWDPCTGIGTPGGVWTFAHLIREMANGSGRTPEQFALEWLSLWLNSYAPNSDAVAPRVAMFNQVIQPWAVASGVTATLVTSPTTGLRSVTLSGPLNLNIAPFRLLAIVNRIDLGETVRGGGGYGGSTTDLPVTAGELRFIFDVVQPNPWGAGGSESTCGKKLFTTIFEYGVPRTGCTSVVNWAQQWTSLLTLGGFTPAYRAQLQSMTESVVLHGKAPAKGNQNAINQVRTNEVALVLPTSGIWELREFTLSIENPAAGTDTPANGPLRGHTVAQTPNDGAFSAGGADATINAFVNGPVTAGVSPFVVNPHDVPPFMGTPPCEADYNVPYIFSGRPFRGGNALIQPGHWAANSITPASGDQKICARHQFSFNTCQGCHRDDTANIGPVSPIFVNTSFTQVVPTDAPPVRESKFLTGVAPGTSWDVTDTQLLPITNPPYKWPFADLDRRFRKLFTIAHCTSCFSVFLMLPQITSIFQVVPIDIDPGDPPPTNFKIGPVTDIATVQTLLDQRAQFAGTLREEPAGFIRGADRSVH